MNHETDDDKQRTKRLRRSRTETVQADEGFEDATAHHDHTRHDHTRNDHTRNDHTRNDHTRNDKRRTTR